MCVCVCVCVWERERERERVTYGNACLCRLHQVCSGSLSENNNRPKTMKDQTHIQYYRGHLYRKYWSHFLADQKRKTRDTSNLYGTSPVCPQGRTNRVIVTNKDIVIVGTRRRNIRRRIKKSTTIFAWRSIHNIVWRTN